MTSSVIATRVSVQPRIRRTRQAFRRTLVFTLALFGTAPALAQTTATPSAPLGEVRFVASSPDLTFLPMLLAAELGLDREAGYTSNFTYAASPLGIKAMISGDFEFSLSVSSNLSAAVQGAPIRLVAVHARKSLFSLYAKTEIKSLKDLENQTVGISAMGDATQIAAQAAMKAAGTDVSKVTFVGLGQANVPAALLSGTIAAGILPPPRELPAEKTGKFHSLGFMGDYWIVPGMGMATSQTLIKTKPELVQAVINTAQKAQHVMRTDKARTAAFMAKLLKLTPEDAERSWERLQPYLADTIALPADQQQLMMENQMTITKPRSPPTVAAVFDMSFAQKAK